MMIHKRISEMTLGVRKFIFIKGAVGILISLTYILQAIFLGKIVTQLYKNQNFLHMKYNLGALILMLLIRIVLVWGNQVYGKWIVSQVKNRLRKRAYTKLMELGPGYMTNNRTGQLESTIIAGIDYLEGYLTLYIPQLIVCVVGSGAIVTYMFTIHKVLGALALVTLLIALYSPMLFVVVLTKFTEDHWQAYMDLNAEFIDTTQGMITLKAFNASERIGNQLKHKMHVLFRKTMISLRINLAEVGISGFASSLGSAFTLALAAYYTAKGVLSLGQLSILLFITVEVFRPVTELGVYFHQGFMGMTSTEGILSLFDEKPFVEDKKDAVVPEKLFENPPSIDFSSVRFSYEENTKEVINNLNLKIKPGEKLAIVGESGSGKTTLINLVMRFYDPLKGDIFYNHINIKDIPLKNLRQQVAVVSQDTYLFNGSMAENLRLAKEDAEEDELISACKAAKIHDFIMSMPKGYNTPVGERGLNLSGGQRQRVAIARAMLKGASLIILDEATSSVDVENERAIQESLEYLMTDKTGITIAHRLSTISNADRIIVLRDGVIVEEGRHEELMEKQSYYYRLVLAQKEGV